MKQHIQARDKAAESYDKSYLESHKYFDDELKKIVLALNPTGKDLILDAGCGTGLFSQYIAKFCFKLYGIDYSMDSLIEFENKDLPNVELYKRDITKPLNLKYYFDKVVSIQVIQHIPTHELRLQALKNIREVMKKGGVLVCELQDWTAFCRRKKRILQKLKGGFDKGKKELILDHFYIYRFSPNEFLSLLEQAGFKQNTLVSKAKGGYFITKSIR